MRTTRSPRGLPRVLLLLLLSTFIIVSLLMSSARAGLHPHVVTTRSHRHHRPLTDEQKADQNLQFMLSLYRSAAEPDGRPKQPRKFGSNMVRLVRPSAASLHYLPAARDHHYSFTVQYDVDTLPSEQLIRASFVHLRSSSSLSGAAAARAPAPPRCRALITSVGKDSLVTLEPHERWTETDITAHVQRRRDRGAGGHLTLTAQYWCAEDGGLSRRWTRLRGRTRWGGEPHLGVPSLLLYLEEEREAADWMGDLLGAEGETFMRRIGRFNSSAHQRRRRRSKEHKDPPLDLLKHAPASSSSASILSDIPSYRRKTGVPSNRCKLHSFRLSFNKLGLGHYFIAPPVYNPRFCQGDCPQVLHYGYHSPNHAIIQTLINDLGVGDVPTPSCVPYKYMPMSVLMEHKNKVEYRELEEMVAESCTCR